MSRAIQPLASASQLNTPSRQDGIPKHLEDDLRFVGAAVIQQAGLLVELPQMVMATAAILFQRFWFVSSLKHFGITDIALSALFLATKLEEHPTRIRDLINAVDFIVKRIDHSKAQIALSKVKAKARALTKDAPVDAGPLPALQYQPMDYYAKLFYDMKEGAVIGEMQILKRLGFNLTCQHAYGALVNYLRLLELTQHPTIPRRAWGFCNDALLTDLFAIHPPMRIAVGAIYLAALLSTSTAHPVVLPLEPRPWWELFETASEEPLIDICTTLLAMYERWGGLEVKHDAASIWLRVAEQNLPLTKTALREKLEHLVVQ